VKSSQLALNRIPFHYQDSPALKIHLYV